MKWMFQILRLILSWWRNTCSETLSYQYWQIDLKLEKIEKIRLFSWMNFISWFEFESYFLRIGSGISLLIFFAVRFHWSRIERYQSLLIDHICQNIYSLSIFKLSAIPISLMRSNKKNYFFAYEATNNNIKNIFAFLCHPKKLVNLYTRISFDDIDSRNVRQKNGERINE